MSDVTNDFEVGTDDNFVPFFFRNPDRHFQAAQLASLYLVLGLLRTTAVGVEAKLELRSIASCLLLCQAYETYVDLHAAAERLSFEHAWFLLLALARRREIGLSPCPRCGGVRLKDLLSRRGASCNRCEQGNLELPFGDPADPSTGGQDSTGSPPP